MGVKLESNEFVAVKEVPSGRKFQRFIRYVNDHVFRRGSLGKENPHPYEHFAQSVKWDNGFGGGMSIYDKMLEKRGEIVLPNDRTCTVVISHLPDTTGSRTLFLDRFNYVCDGTNDRDVLQRAVDQILATISSSGGGKGKIFVKHGTYVLPSAVDINITTSIASLSTGVSIVIEGEPGTIFQSQDTNTVGCFNVNILGQNDKMTSIEFRGVTFTRTSAASPRAVYVQHGSIATTSLGPSRMIFNKCSFPFSGTGFAVEGVRSGTATSGGHFLFRKCYFKKSTAGYMIKGLSIADARRVDIDDCCFYDLVTGSTSNGPWTRNGYSPRNIAEDNTQYYVWMTLAGVFNNRGAGDSTVISGPMVEFHRCEYVRILNSEFKHCDTAVFCVGSGLTNYILDVSGCTFYQTDAYRLPHNGDILSGHFAASDLPSVLVACNCTASILNNVILGRMTYQSVNTGEITSRQIYPISRVSGGNPIGSLAHIYNVTNLNGYAVPGLSDKKFTIGDNMFRGSSLGILNYMAHKALRTFRKWKTDRDLPIPTVLPRG